MPVKGISAAKRERQNEKRRIRNRVAKSNVRTVAKDFLKSIKTKDLETAEKQLKNFAKLMDTAATKGIFHKSTAARKKSRLQKLLNKTKNAA